MTRRAHTNSRFRARLVSVGLAVVLGAAAPGSEPDGLLGPQDLDAARVLPPPPAPDSAQAKAELVELHAAETRSPVEEAEAIADGKRKTVALFAEAVGPGFDLARLPATARLFDLVRASEKAVVDRGKDAFKRPRPWIIDPSVKTCARGEEPLSSYPSGHATFAYAMAGVLAQLVPDRAQPILARAARYAQTRITCEQHFRSDVTAGEALGLLVAERLRTKPVFVAAYAAAAHELKKARVTR